MSTPSPDERPPARPGAPPRGLTPFVVVIGIALLVVTIAMLARRDNPPAPEPSVTTSMSAAHTHGPVELWPSAAAARPLAQ